MTNSLPISCLSYELAHSTVESRQVIINLSGIYLFLWQDIKKDNILLLMLMSSSCVWSSWWVASKSDMRDRASFSWSGLYLWISLCPSFSLTCLPRRNGCVICFSDTQFQDPSLPWDPRRRSTRELEGEGAAEEKRKRASDATASLVAVNCSFFEILLRYRISRLCNQRKRISYSSYTLFFRP